jgi:hypothetical protein
MAHTHLASILLVLPFLMPAADQPDTCSATSSVADVQFTLSLKDHGPVFQLGEIVPLELAFTSSTKDRYTANSRNYDRSGRLGIETYCVEPNTPDPLASYFQSGGFLGGGLGGIHELNSTPKLAYAELNEWRRLAPGHYRVYAISYRVSRAPDAGDGTPDPQIGVVVRSNAIDFEVSPADPAWQAAQLSTAVQALAHPSSPDDARRAARILRFLDTRESAAELARLFWGLNEQPGGWDLMFGLYGSPFRQAAIDAMRAAAAAPEHAVTSEFLRTLVGLQIQADPAWDPPKYDPAHPQAAEAFWERRRKHESELTEAESRATLAALGRKTGAARALTVNGLLMSGASNAALVAALRPALIASWDDLPRAVQDDLILYRWSLVASREMLPILRRIVAEPVPPNRTMPAMVRDAALRNLFELDAAAGRQAILKDLLDLKAEPSLAVLGLLPKEDLTKAAAAAVDRIAKRTARGVDYELVDRYADAKGLEPVQKTFEPNVGKWACAPQTAMLRFFLRVAPEYGVAQVKASFDARKTTGCYRSLLTDLGDALPAVQQIAMEALNDSDSEVQESAARALSKWGAAEAEAALWKALERLHAEWAARQDELRFTPGSKSPGSRAVALERALIGAISQAVSWPFSPDRVLRVGDLALTESSRQSIEGWMKRWTESPAYIFASGLPGNTPTFSILQYQGLTEDQLVAKLAQLPPGIELKWQFAAYENIAQLDKVYERVCAAAAKHGLTIGRSNHP